MQNDPIGRDRDGLLLVANWRSDVGYAWWFMERIWLALAEVHAGAGGKVHIIYPEVRGIPPAVAAAGIKVHQLDFSDEKRESRERLERLIRDERIGAVYLTDRAALDRTYARLRRWGVKVLVNNDQTPGDRTASMPRKLVKFLLQRLQVFSCDLYIAPSEFVMRRFRDVYQLPRNKCILIPNGIEPVEVEGADRDYVRREFALPTSAVVVVSLSRAVHYKGVASIIECADRLINGDGHDHVYFVHCGDGPDMQEFRELVARRGLEGRFFLPGARPDYRRILASSDIAMHASHGEGFSLAVLECMSAGLGMLVPDNSGNREAIEHDVSGFRFRPGDLDQASDFLRRLVTDVDVRVRLGAAARRTVLERFTLDETLRRFKQDVAPVLLRGCTIGAPSLSTT